MAAFPPVRIPYGCQSIDQQDINAVMTVLQSDWLIQGPQLPRFEAAVAEWVGAAHGVGVSSGTAALHLACLALGVGPGDLVWTSPMSFVASANCARYCGADVDFVDIDSLTGNMDSALLESKLQQASISGRLPKVLIVVHFAGQPVDMEVIARLAVQYGVAVIEDAAHALGARYQDHAIGACRYSQIAIFSFHPVKAITTGEGGMAVTNDATLAVRMMELRSHGITRDASRMQGEVQGPWYYQQIALGYNYRMNEMQAALGVSQMTKLAGFIAARNRLARQYQNLLSDLPLILPVVGEGRESAWHLYVIQVEDPAIRLEVFNALRAAGIGVNVHYIPIHTQPDFQRLGFKEGQFPNAEVYYGRAISIPLFPTLSDLDQQYVADTLRKILTHR